MLITLCDVCGKKIPDREAGYTVSRGDFLGSTRLCSTCGKGVEPLIRKIEAAKAKATARKSRG